ncbi:Tkl protein kinase, partial [Globisporangium splendens]
MHRSSAPSFSCRFFFLADLASLSSSFSGSALSMADGSDRRFRRCSFGMITTTTRCYCLAPGHVPAIDMELFVFFVVSRQKALILCITQTGSGGRFPRVLFIYNVLVSDSFRAKITDFGLTRLNAKTKTTTASHVLSSTAAGDGDDDQDDVDGGGVCGTAGCTAPVLLKSNVLASQSTGVYSFGVLLNELTQEEVPYYESLNKFRGKGPYAAVQHARNGGRPAIHAAKTSAELRVLIEQCWHKDTTKRPSFGVLARRPHTMEFADSC